MDQYCDYLKKKHFPITRGVFKREFSDYKVKLPEEEFNKRFFKKYNDSNLDFPTYYEIIADNPTDQEFTIFLLDELLAQQKVTARKTSIITGIVIFWLICSIISGINIAVTLSDLL